MAYVDMNVGLEAKQTETVLWTNSTPTSTFNAQTVTLSDSVRNYDYLKFVYNLNNENQTTCSTIMSVSDFVNTKYQAGYFIGEFGCMATTSGTLYPWARQAHYNTDTTIAIKNCITAGTNVTINTRLIPTAIIGIKNMGGKEQGSDWATISVATTGTSNVCTGYAVASNSNKFTAFYTNGSASGTITVLEEGLYDYAFTKANRGTGTATVKIGNQSYNTGKGEIYIAANTVCTASVGGTAGSLGLACITLVKKS